MGQQVHVCRIAGDAGNGFMAWWPRWATRRSRERLGGSGSRPCREEVSSDLASRWWNNRYRWVFLTEVYHRCDRKTTLVPNTTLRSRVLGKPLMARFPSPLPSDTVLDCILDQNWRENGILHVLDVIKWKGQDISDCESSFRSAAPCYHGHTS